MRPSSRAHCRHSTPTTPTGDQDHEKRTNQPRRHHLFTRRNSADRRVDRRTRRAARSYRRSANSLKAVEALAEYDDNDDDDETQAAFDETQAAFDETQAAFDETQAAFDDAQAAFDVAQEALSEALAALEDWKTEEGGELAELETLAASASAYASDWLYGVQLISESYFTEYAQQLAEDCYDMKDANVWPFTCIDWEAAAGELKTDYTTVDFGGTAYYVR